MNCSQLFFDRLRSIPPDRLAIQVLVDRNQDHPNFRASFFEVAQIAARTQQVLQARGLNPGDPVLVFDALSPRLFGSVIGMLASGFPVILVEPWLPLHELDAIIQFSKPRAFWTHPFGRLWGARSAAIRSIPIWVSSTEAMRSPKQVDTEIVNVDELHPGIITFTSGTTGNPKGSVRHHRLLLDQNLLITRAIDLDRFERPDLTVFANLVLANLAMGRGSLIVPPQWPESIWSTLECLPERSKPVTLACGPAFLKLTLSESRLSNLPLESVHVGGALTDCWIFEEALRLRPEVRWLHVYGSSEAEPVTVSDVHKSIAESRERGLFQSLYVGNPIPQVRSTIEPDTVWVTGPHVCRLYAANEKENRMHKRIDAQGTVWHRMGDRIRADQEGWWYWGRSHQSAENFALEQAIYSVVGSSRCFVHVSQGKRVLYGERVLQFASLIRKRFPEIEAIYEGPILRDRRHRARLDRVASLKKGAPWL